MREAPQLEVWAGPSTAGVVSSGDEESNSLAAAKRAGIYPPEVKLASCPVARILDSSAEIEIGDTCLTPIAAPGHSRDMTCYLLRQRTRVPGHGTRRLRDAQQEFREAMSYLDRLLLPPNL